MINKKLYYKIDPVPQYKEPPRFEPETIGSKILFGFSFELRGFFSVLVLIGLWESLNQFFKYLSGLF
jgi:hypothetical protein